MKKFISVLLSATLLLGIVGCGGSGSSSDKLIVGLDDSFPPMGYRDENNEIVGFDIDLAKAAAEKMGVEVEFQPIDWDSKEMEIETGKIDLIWNGFSINPEREETFELTKPYLNNRQVILVPQDSAISSKADLAGKNVGVQDGSTALDAVNADEIHTQFASNPTYDTNILAIEDLKVGRVDAVVVDEVVANNYIQQNPDANLKTLSDDFGAEQYAIAAKKGNTELIDKLQSALDELNADGTSAEISNKWFGEDIVVK